jgi:hypothetical protein
MFPVANPSFRYLHAEHARFTLAPGCPGRMPAMSSSSCTVSVWKRLCSCHCGPCTRHPSQQICFAATPQCLSTMQRKNCVLCARVRAEAGMCAVRGGMCTRQVQHASSLVYGMVMEAPSHSYFVVAALCQVKLCCSGVAAAIGTAARQPHGWLGVAARQRGVGAVWLRHCSGTDTPLTL